MIRRAEWRVRADEPQTDLGWIVGSDRPFGLPAYGVVVLASAATIVLLEVASGLIPSRWSEGAVMLAFVLFMSRLHPSRAKVRAPDPAPIVSHDVAITLSVDGRTLGHDRGLLVFSEGWFVYEGRRTSFALSPNDIAAMGLNRIALQDGTTLRLAHAPASQEALTAWLGGSSPEGFSRLPPRSVHPKESIGRAGYLRFFSAATLGGASGVVLIHPLDIVFAPMLAIVLGCVLVALILLVLARRKS